MTSLHQQLVNFYLLIITIQFMGISQSLSMSADNFFFSSPEQNPKSKLQRETRKQGGRKRRGGRRAVKGRGSDSKPHSCPPARQHGVTELANTLNQKMQLPCKTKFLAFTSWWQHGVALLHWKSPNPPNSLWLKDMMPFLKLEKTTCFSFIILVTHQPCL